MNTTKLRHGVMLALVTTISTPVLAEDMSYTYIQGAYIDTEIDERNFEVDGDGVAFSSSAALGDTFFLQADYATQEFDFGIDLDQWAVGLGAHLPIASNVDLVGSLNYVRAEVDTNIGDLDDDGYGVAVGLRSRLTDYFELEGGMNYVDLNDTGDGTSFNVGGRYYFTPAFALGVGYQVGDDVNTWTAGFRYEFK